MRVSIVGAGPSGLYLAILMKKADAAHEITVTERNAPDATFGWGVVFSEETLGALRDADYATYLEITDSFARWTSIDIRYRGQVLRSSGHSFSAIKRTHLLDILQRRCRELGVDLRFGVEVSTMEPADLVVAADGANSTLRRAGRFDTSTRPQGCKYVWFGTDLVFDAFTFIFKATEHGLFQVHAYPFDEHTSTFIVETTESTWRRAGLDTMSEDESIAFCSDLFAEELGDHRLMSNKSSWLDFPLVRNASWHDGNVVLIGDAAHTAHFSIGSGTKLAMEDAIALANSFVRHPANVEQALTDYELERQSVVERFQQASVDSSAYFERVGHYTRLAPIQFAFNLLTRSGRISHANLTQRDPSLTRVLDSWFAATATGSGTARPGAVAAPPMFAPLRLGGLTVRNRIVRTAAAEGLDEVARTGAGLVLTGLVAVCPDGRTTPACPVLDESWAPVVDKVHDAGALVGVRLG
ncbi:MAG TPA: FAD-dependent monooxygenase, partial [Actinophytocola sp.]|nr:FAD-dependent monooxygenase [Actinophytocola sp.]